jgi:hypothetical protein
MQLPEALTPKCIKRHREDINTHDKTPSGTDKR